MIDVWMKPSPSGKAVAYKIEGSSEAGFIFSAQMEGRDTIETSGQLKQPTRAEVEAHFADYAAGK